MTTLAQLAKRLRREEDKIVKNASERAKDVALAILADVTVRTPVDTGKAASNWQVSINAPVSSEIDAYSPGAGGNTAQKNVDMAYEVGKAAIESKKPGEPIFISNVTEYIGYLNDGSSYQAPAGFVERAIMIGKKRAKNSPVRIIKNG